MRFILFLLIFSCFFSCTSTKNLTVEPSNNPKKEIKTSSSTTSNNEGNKNNNNNNIRTSTKEKRINDSSGTQALLRLNGERSIEAVLEDLQMLNVFLISQNSDVDYIIGFTASEHEQGRFLDIINKTKGVKRVEIL